MTNLVFLDTNILIYAAQSQGPEIDKKLVAMDIVRRENYATSGQVLAEFFANVTKKGRNPLPRDRALDWIRELARKPCQAIDANIIETAVAISTRYQTSYWDAAILAAAARLGAKTVYTEDLNHNQRYDNVRVINPFLDRDSATV